MATVYDGIDAGLAAWLAAQPVVFVGTAPLAGDGRVNVSPKGMGGTFAVLGEHAVAHPDHPAPAPRPSPTSARTAASS